MSEKYSELLNNTKLLAISNFSSKILVFLLVPIYTAALTTAEAGLYDLAYTTILLMYPILTLMINEATIRFLIDKDNSPKEVFSIGIKHVLIGSLIFGLGLQVVRILNVFDFVNDYHLYVWIYFFSYCFNLLLIQLAKGTDHVLDMAIAGVIGSVVMVSLNIIFLLVMELHLKGFFLANIIGQLVPACFLFFRLKAWKYIDSHTNKTLRNAMLLYSVPLIMNELGWWANSTSDRYIVSAIVGVEANGLLSTAYKIPSIITVVVAIFFEAWQISVLKNYSNQGDDEFYSNMFCYWNAILCTISGALILCTPLLARIFFRNDFYQAWIFVPFLIVSATINGNSGFIGPILSAQMKSREMSISAFCGILVNIILNIYLAMKLGPQGITIATMIASSVIFFLRLYFSNGIVISNMFSMIVVSWVLLIVMSYCSIYLNMFWLSCVIYCVIIIIYRNYYKKALTLIRRQG